MIKQFLVLLASAVCAFATVIPSEYTYKTVNNISIKAFIYLPNVTLYEKYPVVMAIHGGAFVAGAANLIGSALSLQELNEILGRGWVIASINYRLSPDALLPDMVSDVQDAYNWIRNDLVDIVPINPNAIAIWGDSAGGGLTVISGYKLSPPPKALLVFYPYCPNLTGNAPYVYDPDTPVSPELINAANALRTPLTEYTPVPNDPRFALAALARGQYKQGWTLTTADPNASPDDIMAELKEYSVVYHINSSYPPSYLIHGMNAATIPYSQSVNMADVLKSQNVSYVLDIVPDVGHAFDLGGVSEEMWEQHLIPVFDFTQKYIGLEALSSLSLFLSTFILFYPFAFNL